MNKNSYEKAVWDSRSLTSSQKLVALAFAKHANYKTGKDIYPSQVRISKETGLGRNTVNRAVKVLIDRGWLVPVGKQTKNVYNFELPSVVPSDDEQEVELANAVEEYLASVAPSSTNRAVAPSDSVAPSDGLVAPNERLVAPPVNTNVVDLRKNLNTSSPDGLAGEIEDKVEPTSSIKRELGVPWGYGPGEDTVGFSRIIDQRGGVEVLERHSIKTEQPQAAIADLGPISDYMAHDLDYREAKAKRKANYDAGKWQAIRRACYDPAYLPERTGNDRAVWVMFDHGVRP